jgi:hypothetical protein
VVSPASCWSIPLFRAKIPHFTSKIVEHSRHLPVIIDAGTIFDGFRFFYGVLPWLMTCFYGVSLGVTLTPVLIPYSLHYGYLFCTLLNRFVQVLSVTLLV